MNKRDLSKLDKLVKAITLIQEEFDQLIQRNPELRNDGNRMFFENRLHSAVGICNGWNENLNGIKYNGE